MRITRDERVRAERVSAAVDELIRHPEALPVGLDREDLELLATARRLRSTLCLRTGQAASVARLPELLGPAGAELEQRLLRDGLAGAKAGRGRRPLCLRPGWAVAAVAMALLLVTLLTPFGQTAVASFMAVFKLGRTEVAITPVEPSEALVTADVQATAIQESLTLAEARRLPYAILQPAWLPPGYGLRSVTGYTYPDLPAWVPQPFSVKLVYGDGQGHECSLRLYPITLGEGDRLNVSRLNLKASSIQDVRDVEVDGRPGVLLQVGEVGGKVVWQEVVWEQGGVLLSLSTLNLTEAELMRVARSVR